MTKMQANEKDTALSRRDFVKMGIGALSGLALLEFGGASFFFMKSRSLTGEYGGMVTAGLVASFPAGSVTHFPDGRFYLVCAADGGFLAVYTRCTHLGCAVNWEPEQERFFCPCHASSFDQVGDVSNPPAPRALDMFLVTVADGTVLVDTGSRQRRDQFTADQLAYA